MGCRVYLRVAIGALNAFWVIAVGAFALLVTYTVSMQQLEDNGDRHVAAIAVTAALTVDTFFGRVEGVVQAAQGQALFDSYGHASEHPSRTSPHRSALGIIEGGVGVTRMVDTWVTLMAGVNNTLFSLNYWLLDGSRMLSLPMHDTQYLYLEYNYQDANGTLQRNYFGFDRGTGLVVRSGANAFVDSYVANRTAAAGIIDIRVPAVKAAVRAIIAPLEYRSAPRWSAVRFFYEFNPNRYLVAAVPLHNATRDWVGYAAAVVTLDSIGATLDRVRSTPGARVAVLGLGGYIISATSGVDVYHTQPYSGGALPPGCTSTDMTGAIIPSTRRLMSCQYHLRESNVPALRELARRGVPAPGLQAKLQAGGHRYFVRTEGLDRSTVPLRVVVLLPEEDILGDVERTVVIAGIATAAVVLVAAALSFFFVWAMLWPLVGIADSMGKAARLEDDTSSVRESRLVEIGDLQRAFVQMRDELSRIRAFVPQSLLRAADTDEEASEAAAARDQPYREAPALPSSTASSSSQPSRPTTNSSRVTSPPAPGLVPPATAAPPSRALRTADAVGTVAVSVLCGNLRGFHAAARAGPCLKSAAATVEAVLWASTLEKGVVDSFHGDRFRVSFNAVRPAANHGIRATVTALRLCNALEGSGYGLPVTCGVASGLAHVGNVGCDALKRFTVVGPVVSQAACLERMCKLYRGVHCLVPERLFQDLRTAVALRTVDYVRLPFSSSPCLVASTLRLFATDAQGEWMYQLQCNADRIPAEVALRNKVWDSLAAADATAAASFFAQLPGETPDADGGAYLPDRLAAVVEEGELRPRELGPFYDLALGAPPALTPPAFAAGAALGAGSLCGSPTESQAPSLPVAPGV